MMPETLRNNSDDCRSDGLISSVSDAGVNSAVCAAMMLAEVDLPPCLVTFYISRRAGERNASRCH